MQTATFRIVGPSGVVLADDLPVTAPAIQLHEGKITEPAAPYPKELAPGEFTTVSYPLDFERGKPRRTLACTVTRTDTSVDQRTPELETRPVDPTPDRPTRGGRRSRRTS